MDRAPAEGSGRIAWVDTGRGLAIVLVVLFHSTNWLGEAGFDVSGVAVVNESVASMRLPLFFTLAGMFAVKWATASWRRLWRMKLSLFVWVYGVWSVIATFTFMLGLHLQGARGNYLGQLRDLVWAPVLPRFELWFIWALALFFVIARLLARVPVTLTLPAAAALSVVGFSTLSSVNTGWSGAAKYFFFFLAGLTLRHAILHRAQGLGRVASVTLVVSWIVVAIAGRFLEWNSLPGYYFVSCLLGAAAGIALSKALSPIRGIRSLGSRTLPVYLTHTSVILVLSWALWRTGLAGDRFFAAPLLPFLVTTMAIAASLGLARAAQERPLLRLLYVQPRWFTGRSTSDPFPRADSRATGALNRDVA